MMLGITSPASEQEREVTVNEEFRRLAGMGPMLEDLRLTERKSLNVKRIVKDAEKALGVQGPLVFDKSGFEMTMAVRGKPSPFKAVMDASGQTGNELLWFEIAPESYEAVKSLLPPHKVKRDRGFIVAHPKDSFGSQI